MDANQATPDNIARNEEFARLLGLNQGRVFTYIATLLPCRADAEDVLQRTSIVLWRKFDQFDPSASFVRWAYGVAYREALKYLRQQSRQRQVFREAVLEKLTRTHIARSDLLEKRRLAMDDCVAQLSPTDREIIEHYYYQGKTTAADVAQELGRPTNTVLHALVRIRGSLHRCIDEAVSSEERK
jgi:RNA polymerase sigma-70 factor, ECF subfamily